MIIFSSLNGQNIWSPPEVHWSPYGIIESTWSPLESTWSLWDRVKYTDCAQYKAFFDELQCLTHTLTGQKLRLKQLSKEGTLLSISVDLELAQVLGAGDSFLPTNEPEFSGITTNEPEEIVKYFVHAYHAHVKR